MAAEVEVTPIEEPSGLEAVRPVQSLVADFVSRMVAGELKDGDTLLPLEELAADRRVTMASATGAVNLLSTMELVEIRSEGGPTVTVARALESIEGLRLVHAVNCSLAARLMITLLYIEPPLASLAALNATEENLGDLRDSLRRMAYALDVAQGDCIVLDNQFHSLVGKASRGDTFARMAKSIRVFLTEPRASLEIVHSRDLHAVLDHHTAVYQAIRDRRPRASYDLMQGHISHWMGCNVGLIGGLSRLGAAGEKEKRSRRVPGAPLAKSS